jgi:hypothetical protein
MADAISSSKTLHPTDALDDITDPDEYRLRHPFKGMEMNANTLATTLNGWENNNQEMYKLE